MISDPNWTPTGEFEVPRLTGTPREAENHTGRDVRQLPLLRRIRESRSKMQHRRNYLAMIHLHLQRHGVISQMVYAKLIRRTFIQEGAMSQIKRYEECLPPNRRLALGFTDYFGPWKFWITQFARMFSPGGDTNRCISASLICGNRIRIRRNAAGLAN